MQSFEHLLVESYLSLKDQKDLSPNNHLVNGKLRRLVDAAREIFDLPAHLKCDRSIQSEACAEKLRDICAVAESEMEKFWADHFSDRPRLTLSDLNQFWYYQNYEVLAEKEARLIQQLVYMTEKTTILFAGAGALPLTAILLHVKYGWNFILLDIDPHAVKRAQRLVKKLGLNISVLQYDFFQFDLKSYDIVFVASLIANKSKVIEKLEEDRVKFYLLRGADGIYQTFYEDVPDEFKLNREYTYFPSDSLTINSSYLFRASAK